MKLRHRLKRWVSVVSPSGAYPLPPRWAMSKKGRADWYPPERVTWAAGDRSVAAGGSIGVAVTGTGSADDPFLIRPCACQFACVCVCGPVDGAPVPEALHHPCAAVRKAHRDDAG